MDTSKEYIDMCEKAKELQHSCDEKTLKFIHHIVNWHINEHFEYSFRTFFVKKEDDCSLQLIWLPRQDQLQDMMEYEYPIADLQISLNNFIDDDSSILNEIKSMEQLWLAFVMKKKHNKEWDGKNWVKKEEL